MTVELLSDDETCLPLVSVEDVSSESQEKMDYGSFSDAG